MSLINIKKKQKKRELSVANKKGVILLYGLLLFHLVSLFCAMLIQKVKTNTIQSSRDLSIVELFTIYKAKNDLESYDEKEETIVYLNHEIQFVYDDITCFITILKNDEIVLKSKLEYDDIEMQIVEYVYL